MSGVISFWKGVFRAQPDDFAMMMGLLSHKVRASGEMLLAKRVRYGFYDPTPCLAAGRRPMPAATASAAAFPSTGRTALAPSCGSTWLWTQWPSSGCPKCAVSRSESGRARRLDLVHGLGRLDVPADRGITPGAEASSGQTAFCATVRPN